MRVIAGKYRSRPLGSLKGRAIRPTSDRLRETLFNILCAGNPAALEGSYWLDLYAGTGAVGIEALSRGAGRVDFIESSPQAAALIKKNLRSLGIEHGFSLRELEVLTALGVLEVAGLAADFIFLDPPYRMREAYRQTLGSLAGLRVLKASTLVIAEHDGKFDPGESFPNLQMGNRHRSTVLGRYRKVAQGDAALSFYRLA